MKKSNILFISLISLILLGANFAIEESPVLTPAEEQKTFQLEKGLKIQLVAAEPMVEDPVCINFDQDGRLWVVEMRGYMPDIEGNNENIPNGKIKVLEDTNGDGEMDKSTVFLDSLVLPRAMAFVKGGIIFADHQSLWQATDSNNDLKVDSKILIDKNYTGSSAPEHAANGLLHNLDNWYYNAKSRFRYKLIDNQWVKDSTEFRGQFGIAQDNQGRLFYNYNWSQLHGDLVPPSYLSRNKNHTPSSGIDHGVGKVRSVFPIHPTPNVNRGYIAGVLDENKKLKEFTAACSPFPLRSKALAGQYYENIFVCEPAGNLIKRNVISQNELEISGYDPNLGTEFLASTDYRFRPVSINSGPDGALYIADMYKGIIQHKLYITPYLKDQSIQKGLQKYINKGRIWRIVPENFQSKKAEELSELTSKQLVQKLYSDNGWLRDMAQQQLIWRNDKSVETELTKIFASKNELAKLHALYTFDGLELLKINHLMPLINNKNSMLGFHALRLSEQFAKYNKIAKNLVQQKIQTILPKANIETALQIALSSYVLDNQVQFQVLTTVLEKFGYSPIIKDAVMSSIFNEEAAFANNIKKNTNWKQADINKEIFIEMLTTAMLKKGNSAEIESLLSRIASLNTWQEKSILMGLSTQSNNLDKPITLQNEPLIFAKNNTKIEKYQLDKLEKMFAWPGHIPNKQAVKNQIVLTGSDQKSFSAGRIQYLNTCSGCHGSDGKGVKRFAPTLVGSEWVTGNETRLALIILHGIEGAIEVNGKKYDQPEILPVMPAHSTLDDASITNILNYIRNEWGNNAGPLARGIVGRTRHMTQGRVAPWSPEDLNKHIEGLKAP